jgi:hypothetical protein
MAKAMIESLENTKEAVAIVFALDNQNEFCRTALLLLMGPDRFRKVTGCYKGVKERALVCSKGTFLELLMNSPELVENQESILVTTRCNKLYASLMFFKDGSRLELGSLHTLPKEEALSCDAWSYRPDLGKYFVAKRGNPNRKLR